MLLCCAVVSLFVVWCFVVALLRCDALLKRCCLGVLLFCCVLVVVRCLLVDGYCVLC